MGRKKKVKHKDEPSILVIDDEISIQEALKDILLMEGYDVTTVSSGKEAIKEISEKNYKVALCDIKMQEMDGIEVLEAAKKIRPETIFIMLSGHGTIETAVKATKKGAFDFIEKPPDLDRLLFTIRNAVNVQGFGEPITESRKIKTQIINENDDIIGASKSIEQIKKTIEKVAPTEARILITGNNGTGKELVARWIHQKSNRNGELIAVNCAAIPSELIESELFGHEKGAFTSAHKKRIGKFEQAENGTLFLDEIGDMSLPAQSKVLRALQENYITPVGSNKNIKVTPRIVAATNKNLYDEIKKGKFREDLYHRLSVIVINVPPLKERLDDIPILAEHFMTKICQEYQMPKKHFTKDAIRELKKLEWRGNIRELRNIVERLAILCPDKITSKNIIDYASPNT